MGENGPVGYEADYLRSERFWLGLLLSMGLFTGGMGVAWKYHESTRSLVFMIFALFCLYRTSRASIFVARRWIAGQARQ